MPCDTTLLIGRSGIPHQPIRIAMSEGICQKHLDGKVLIGFWAMNSSIPLVKDMIKNLQMAIDQEEHFHVAATDSKQD